MLEMKLLLALFAFENLILCMPLWIISHSIYNRNIFLDEFFPQLIEEQRSTKASYVLTIISGLGITF